MEAVSPVGLLNFVLFQVGWFSAVLSAAHDRPWLGVAVVLVLVALHLRLFAGPHEARLVVASAVLGVAVDSGLKLSGLVHYAGATWPQALAPAWIVAMWANLAITLEHSLAWLGRGVRLPAILGAVAGPLAYRAAEALGAVRLEGWPALAALAVLWGGSLTVLVRIRPSRARSS